jgi:Na+-driven multidrug efflux pump
VHHLAPASAILRLAQPASPVGMVIGYWTVGLPAAWLLSHPLGLETVGIWLGLLTGLATTAVQLRRYGSSLAARAA